MAKEELVRDNCYFLQTDSLLFYTKPKITMISRKVKVKMLPKKWGVNKILKGRKPTPESINLIVKEIGSFIKPLNYKNRGKLGEKMRELIGRSRANDDGFVVARKRRILVKPHPSNETMPFGGCHPASLAVYEVLREMEKKFKVQLKPKVCRVFNPKSEAFHTTVVFQLDGTYWEADPFHARVGTNIKQITKEDALSRRTVPPIPISFEKSKLENYSENGVRKLIELSNQVE